jgi:RNA polymerase sigma factor (sigma-70 family)
VYKLGIKASWSVSQFSRFYIQNRFELIRHANRILKDSTKAEEITQEALVKFMLAAPELESDNHALAYLHRTIENLCIDLFRAENRKPNLVALDSVSTEVDSIWQVSGDHSLVISAAEDAEIIRRALSLLSPAERAAIVMWEVEGRSTAEIAVELGIKESSVRHTVSRARTSLRKILSELVIDEKLGLTAMDLLSKGYKRLANTSQKTTKIALTFILVVSGFLGLNSITGNDNLSQFTTMGPSQSSKDQDMTLKIVEPKKSELELITSPATKVVNIPRSEKIISAQDYANHLSLTSAQLETLALMIAVLDQTSEKESALF